MGMAASQARYLGLAARRTNCEYQGQQINQARTALGNQSAELWNQMLGLSVPTAPNPTDFAKTQYSFTDGQNDYEITSMVPTEEEEGYNYSIKYKYYEQEIKGIENINTNPQVQDIQVATCDELASQTLKYVTDHFEWNDGTTNNTLTEITDTAQKEKAIADLKKAGVTVGPTDKVYTAGTDNYYIGNLTGTADIPYQTVFANLTLGESSYKVGNAKTSIADRTDAEIEAALQKIAEDNAGSKIATAITAGEDIYTYQKNGKIYYASKADLDEAINSSNAVGVTSPIDKQDPMKQYYTSQIKTEKVMSDYALMDDASGSGRYSSVKLEKYNSTFGLNTETVTNDDEYQNALNQYYYDTQQYEKTLADINAKTELIQNEDRTLELRLKQLDTEHNALQTEMEAVKKVVDKNVEETFKTFGG